MYFSRSAPVAGFCAIEIRMFEASERESARSFYIHTRVDLLEYCLLPTYFSLSEAAAAHSHKHNNMHMTMHANLQKLLHMVLDDIMHHLAMARPVAWVAWKLSEQRTAK